MVHDFFPELLDTQIGWRAGSINLNVFFFQSKFQYYSLLGFLAASFNLGQLFGSIIWGKLADRLGRFCVVEIVL